MKTLYTGHATVGTHEVYSFIYADTLLEAEEYLASLLNCYLRDYHMPAPPDLPQIKVISRPGGWEAPDGYYLPATSKQYALRYPSNKLSRPPLTVENPVDDCEPYVTLTTEPAQKETPQNYHN